ncbi:MAG TPA: cysteine peptidase family C39 domain-containing protein [Planctomycetota bacterium]|nr:cysteine peptidase family C39 domain-containing protein [Planctomycetota bacterium]
MASALLITGCSYLGSARDFDPGDFSRDPRWIRAGDVPLVLQKAEHDCGAAAVAMVLAHWNRRVPFDRIIAGLPGNYTQRYTAADLKTVLQSHGLKAHAIAGAQEHVFGELAKGRPSIAGLGKISIDGARPHFEVVVAYHPVENRVVTLDPARGWRVNSLDGFLDEWDLAKRTLIVTYEVQ